ncbi:Exo5p NDAI_0C05380 [Naumovozyma dairenensis CBS 421]|uniref:Exonuclease V, mitochondrial n=1 Tax=Naumovozyma dairenensis (strain ATCC 10597 / BCRC 20456 / CBS 421 / NBRC 0211 / NRRL Y-12639) TaxID=1071378 RepID=G0W8T6_NAUDC|nr:hypothetical protein NDAI_0C05380 [Naumovozyma dairenensis CBS 421]CCD24197.1 hypothetical protein NDAI_0C05380 [Naumovozyma dairenensis CBS 421]
MIRFLPMKNIRCIHTRFRKTTIINNTFNDNNNSNHELVSNEDPRILTPKETDLINNLPIFQQNNEAIKSKISNGSSFNKEKKDYIRAKIDVLKPLFPSESYPDLLGYNLPHDSISPYIDTQASLGTNRLSVTKLLTKSWCELRTTYDLYAESRLKDIIQPPRDKYLESGSQIHNTLELELHPKLLDLGWELEPDLFDSWFDTLKKFVSIWKIGESREILTHGYLNNETLTLLLGDQMVRDENDVLISGIIDHLKIRDKIRDKNKDSNAQRMDLDLDLDLNTMFKDCDNIDTVLETLEKNFDTIKENKEILISDVKTRSTNKIPTQFTILKATKLQIMYYKFFLENLGISVAATYHKLLTNAERRGIDPNTSIDPYKLLTFMISTNGIFDDDMAKLRDGFDIGFELFDSEFNMDSSTDMSNVFDMSHIQLDTEALNIPPETIDKYNEFSTNWSRPVTLKYFAARLAQFYFYIGQLVSNQLSVEYYHRNENFHNLLFNYDEEFLQTNVKDSGSFWFGKRDIEPIRPNVKNFKTFCKYCDYADVCAWKFEGEEKCKELGSDLQNIYEKKDDMS